MEKGIRPGSEYILIPFFFGSGDYQLFGVYHQPEINAPKSHSILICSPIAHEYLRAYRILRKLAEQLAKNGNHVFRFDWYGHGDSRGSFDECRLSIWIQNLISAIDELNEYSGHNSVSIVGLRFGTTLSLLASENIINKIDHIVLWDPLFKGTKWIEDLTNLHSASSYLKSEMENSDYIERIGFPYSIDLINDIKDIDVFNFDSKYESVNIFSENNTGSNQPVSSAHNPASFSLSDTHIFWNDPKSFDRIIMFSQVIKSISDIFKE